MELRVLRYFLGVAVSGSMTGAARVLHVTQPTLSRQLQELEEELLGYVNALGIGPMGLGGNTTCLAVNIEYSNTGTYILPVAVKIGCWLIHRKTARLFNDGTVQYL